MSDPAAVAPEVASQIISTVAAASDAVIAPSHEHRLARIEEVFEKWEPLLLKLAAVAEKVVD